MFIHVLNAKPEIRDALGGAVIVAWMYAYSFLFPLIYVATLLFVLLNLIVVLQHLLCLRRSHFSRVPVHQGTPDYWCFLVLRSN